ncbi:MAG: hypothetical protein KGH69_00465 [Candidatus Micrarchaeota archaeon]|nr:hypothetical protein [Candidatus Micrarchaeota archaeon]
MGVMLRRNEQLRLYGESIRRMNRLDNARSHPDAAATLRSDVYRAIDDQGARSAIIGTAYELLPNIGETELDALVQSWRSPPILMTRLQSIEMTCAHLLGDKYLMHELKTAGKEDILRNGDGRVLKYAVRELVANGPMTWASQGALKEQVHSMPRYLDVATLVHFNFNPLGRLHPKSSVIDALVRLIELPHQARHLGDQYLMKAMTAIGKDHEEHSEQHSLLKKYVLMMNPLAITLKNVSALTQSHFDTADGMTPAQSTNAALAEINRRFRHEREGMGMLLSMALRTDAEQHEDVRRAAELAMRAAS